jgi:hypothetical protein
MPAFLRQFFVVLLVLLQMAAPLVHAHIGENGGSHGLHLHELDSLPLTPDTAVLSAIDHELDAQFGVVNVGSAIKHQPLVSHTTPILFLFGDTAGFDIVRNADVVNFSPPSPNYSVTPFLSHNSSRAPPR